MASAARPRTNGAMNTLLARDAPAHDWYRFVLSFPPHLVRDYAQRFALDADSRVLDPFCGTGTTIVEAKKLGVPSCGLEAVPLSRLAASTKVDWTPDPDELLKHAELVAEKALAMLAADGISDEPASSVPRGVRLRRLPAASAKLLLKDSISALPLHKVLVLRDALDGEYDSAFAGHERLALARILPVEVGNLRFGPEVGLGTVKLDAPVVSVWLERVQTMCADLRQLRPRAATSAVALDADARMVGELLEPSSVDAVITSPPYPNEKDYSRTVRLESVLLGYLSSRSDLQAMKKGLVRSNTRGIYRDDADDAWVRNDAEVERIASAIEARRIELGQRLGIRAHVPPGHEAVLRGDGPSSGFVEPGAEARSPARVRCRRPSLLSQGHDPHRSDPGRDRGARRIRRRVNRPVPHPPRHSNTRTTPRRSTGAEMARRRSRRQPPMRFSQTPAEGLA